MKFLWLTALYTLSCIGAGKFFISLISRYPGGREESSDLQSSVHFALGSALLSVAWLFLGLGELLRSGVIWAVLVPFFVLGVSPLVRCGRKVLESACFTRLKFAGVSSFSLLMVLGSVVIAWLGVLAYIRPPFGDADAVYMVYPKIIAATGKLGAMVGGYHDFSAIGLSGELHFAALMAIGSPAIAKLFAWVTGAGILVLLRDFTARLGGGIGAQVIAVLMLLTSSTYSDYLSDGKVDLFPALLGLAAIHTLLLARGSPNAGMLTALAGLLAGFSLTAKFSYIMALLPAALVLIVLQEFNGVPNTPQQLFKRSFRMLLFFGAALFIGALPHLVKNQWIFGHALAPFFGMKSNWADQGAWFPLKDTVWIVATYPMALVFGLYPLMGGNISFLWLAALPLVFLLPRTQWKLTSSLFQISASALVGLLCWLAIKASVFAPRYFLATLIMLIPLPAIAAEHVINHESRPRLISFIFSVLCIVALMSTVFTAPAGVWTALPGKIIQHVRSGSPNCGLAISSYCAGLSALNEKSKPGDRAFVAGYYTYWLKPDLLQCMNDTDDYKLLNDSSSEGVWTDLYENGFLHIAVQKASHGQYLKMLNPSGAPPWLKISAEFEDSDMPVFHLESQDPARKPSIVCAQSGRKAWKPAPAPR